MRILSCVRSVLILVTVVLGIGWAATPARAQPMVGLGNLPGGSYSSARGVSADGSTMVGGGYNALGYAEAFAWTSMTGMVGLGTLPGVLYSSSDATGVSADGSTVVGYCWSLPVNNVSGKYEAFVWTSETGMVGLETLPGAAYPSFSSASGVSADGSTVAGYSQNAQGKNEAFVWTSETGMVGLGTLPNSLYPYSDACGVSADGSTVVGGSYNAQGDYEAFVWTPATGMVGLGFLPGAPNHESEARGVSADGSTVVGYSRNSQGYAEAFRWTSATGMVGLGIFPNALDPQSVAYGVSADGSTVVGYSANSQGNWEAFAWTPTTGMVGLGYLPGALYPSSRAFGVSADGSTVVGESSNAQGNSIEAVMLHLQPAPAQLILALIEQVKGLNLKHGIANSLDSKLDAARHALGDVNNHNNVAAVNALNAFINAVSGQRGKAIPTAEADSLIAAATAIIHRLQ